MFVLWLQQATREAFALALAELAACARHSNPSLAAALDAEKKPAKRQQLEKVAGSMFRAALVAPFVEAAVANNKVGKAAGQGVLWPTVGSSPVNASTSTCWCSPCPLLYASECACSCCLSCCCCSP